MIEFELDTHDYRRGVRIRGAEVLVIPSQDRLSIRISVYDPESADGANHFAVDGLSIRDVYSTPGTTGELWAGIVEMLYGEPARSG